MKKTLFTTLLLTAASVLTFAQKTPVVTTIDIQEVYGNYTKAQEAEEKFKSSLENARIQENDMKQELGQLRDELRDLLAKVDNEALSNDGRVKLKEEIEVKQVTFQEKNQQLREFLQDTNKFLQDRLNAIRQHHIAEVREAAKAIAVNKGADLVLNSTGFGAVVYADEAFDITQPTIDRLNAQAAESEE